MAKPFSNNSTADINSFNRKNYIINGTYFFVGRSLKN